MGFSLKSASETAITLPGSAASAATTGLQAGAADAGVFADLFAGQLGAGGTTSASADDLASTLGLADGKPASLLPTGESWPEGVGKKIRRSAADNAQAGADDTLLAQMQAAALQGSQRPALAEPVTPSRKAGRRDGAEVAGQDELPAHARRQAKSRHPQQQALADAANQASPLAGQPPTLASRTPDSRMPDYQAARQAAVQSLMALPSADRQAVLSQAQQLTDKEALNQLMALSPNERQAAMAQAKAGVSETAAQGRAGPAALNTASTQAPLAASNVLPQAAVVAPAARAEVLPSDVRLLFRREAMQADAEAKAANQALAAASERQMLPPVLPQPTLAAASTASWRIEQPMANTPQWRDEFSQKVGSMVSMNIDSASIQVSPEQLGPLDIAIRFDQQDKAVISVVAANPEAKSIVESSLPQLAKMLEQSGIQLGNTQVSTQQQHQNSPQAQQQAQQQAQEQARQQGQHTPHGQARSGGVPVPDEGRLERDAAAQQQRQNGLSIQA